MKSFLKGVAKPLTKLLEPKFTEVDGSRIPAPHLRFGGQNFAKDEDFLASAEREGQRLVDSFGLNEASRVLEIGSGPGRLATGILRVFGEIQCYVGLDVRKDAIQWGNKHIGSRHPTFRFHHVDVHNDRYNPNGESWSAERALPVGHERFDIVYLYSVFSHMILEDVRRYLGAIRDVLRPEGRGFFTTFVEEHVPDFEINPEGYKRDWKGELHCVRFERNFLERLVEDFGFRMDEFHHAMEADGQSAVYLST